MVSKLMTAAEAVKTYSFPTLKRTGSMVQLKNTDGRVTNVDSDQIVYMRGKGNFGIYGDMRDSHRKSTGYDRSSFIGKVGTGDHRHESDVKRNGKSSRKQDRSIFE